MLGRKVLLCCWQSGVVLLLAESPRYASCTKDVFTGSGGGGGKEGGGGGGARTVPLNKPKIYS